MAWPGLMSVKAFYANVDVNDGADHKVRRDLERKRHAMIMAPAASLTEPLIDPFHRAISYLRVSVTDRCDFRCVYCMSEDMSFLPKAEVLTLEELDRVC